MSTVLPVAFTRFSKLGCRMNAVSSVRENVYETRACSPCEKRLSIFNCSASYHDSASPDRWLIAVMFGTRLKYGRRSLSEPGPGSSTLILRLTKMFVPRVPT